MEAAEVTEARACRGYSDPPWKFQGSALYQFHLVKSDVAKALIPKEFKLVEAFGYTLGGFFLARYDDSPVGAFDELVVIAGIVWNPPTSCAWAARVLVSSKEACVHGRKDVGLPSHVANFSKAGGYSKHRVMAVNRKPEEDKTFGFLRRIGMPSSVQDVREATQVSECSSLASSNLFSINLINSVPLDSRGWMGPPVKMSLPSFSGRTEDNPNLLKYSCQMACRARVMPPLKVITPYAIEELGSKSSGPVTCEEGEEESSNTCRSRLSLLVMLSKPILTLELNSMEMNVEAPVVLSK